MDIYDAFWFHEPGVQQLSSVSCYAPVASPSSAGTPCLSSPSSGYSSADEGRATPVSGWASPTDCLLSSDPYLGDLIMTPTNAVTRRPTDSTTMPSSWSGASLVLDDFMDTLWDSLTSGVDDSTRSADTGSALLMSLLMVAWWSGRRTCDRQVASSTPGRTG